MWVQTGSFFSVGKKAFTHFRGIWVTQSSLKAILYIKHWKIAHSLTVYLASLGAAHYK